MAGAVSGLRAEARGGQMASERLARRGPAERLTSGLRFQWEEEASHGKSWRWGGSGPRDQQVPRPGGWRGQETRVQARKLERTGVRVRG